MSEYLPMRNTLLEEFNKPRANLREHTNSLGLWKGHSFVHQLFEISSRTVLLDNVVVVVALEHIQKSHDVGRFQAFEYVYLGEEGCSNVGVPVDYVMMDTYCSSFIEL